VLNGTDKDFPAFLWCSLLEQVYTDQPPQEIHNPSKTFRVCRTARAPGTKAVIFESVDQHPSSFADHGKEGWYVGQCMIKYRNYKVYANATRATRESNRVDFPPTKCHIPLSIDATRLTAALDNLKHELAPTPAHLTSDISNHGTPLYRTVMSVKNLLSPALTTVIEKITAILTPTNASTKPASDAALLRVVENNNNRNDRSPRVSEVRGRYDIGTTLTKSWEGIPYNGKIISDNGRWYKVQYDDNDEEQLTHREVTKYVQQANKVTYNAYKGLVQQEEYRLQQAFNEVQEFEDKAYSITHPETGKPLENRDLRKDPQFKLKWDLSGAN
jgi:hypothetical protein